MNNSELLRLSSKDGRKSMWLDGSGNKRNKGVRGQEAKESKALREAQLQPQSHDPLMSWSGWNFQLKGQTGAGGQEEKESSGAALTNDEKWKGGARYMKYKKKFFL